MWTFRLRLHMKGGQQEDLFGSEPALAAFREDLSRILDRGGDDAVPWEANGQTVVVDVAGLERIGDLEPVIPASFTFGARSPPSPAPLDTAVPLR